MARFTQQDLQSLHEQHESWIHAQPGVVGSGVGIDKGGSLCLKVFTNHAPVTTRDTICERLGDIPVGFEETGEIRKQDG